MYLQNKKKEESRAAMALLNCSCGGGGDSPHESLWAFQHLHLTISNVVAAAAAIVAAVTIAVFIAAGVVSVCKSSLITGKRPEPDQTRTCQDRKLVGPFRTITAVRSTVQHKSENLKTEQRPVLTGLSSLKVMLALTGLRVCNFYWKLWIN